MRVLALVLVAMICFGCSTHMGSFNAFDKIGVEMETRDDNTLKLYADQDKNSEMTLILFLSTLDGISFDPAVQRISEVIEKVFIPMTEVPDER